MTEKNPYLQHENYFDGYNEKIEELKNKPEILELDKLAYLVFETENGKKLVEALTERYLIPGFVSPHVAHADKAALYFEGFKEAYRVLFNAVKAHKQRIEAESKKNESTQ